MFTNQLCAWNCEQKTRFEPLKKILNVFPVSRKTRLKNFIINFWWLNFDILNWKNFKNFKKCCKKNINIFFCFYNASFNFEILILYSSCKFRLERTITWLTLLKSCRAPGSVIIILLQSDFHFINSSKMQISDVTWVCCSEK